MTRHPLILTLAAAGAALTLGACQPATEEPAPAEAAPILDPDPKMEPTQNDAVADVQPGEPYAPTGTVTPPSATPTPDPQERTVQ